MAFEKNTRVSILHMGNIVGDGVIKRKGPNAQLQGMKLPKGCYGVHVASVIATEPIPLFHGLPKDESIHTLQQAIGNVIAWPFNGVMLKENVLAEEMKEEPSVQDRGLDIDEDTPLGMYLDTQSASSKKITYKKRADKGRVPPGTKERGKGKVVEKEKIPIPGTTIYEIEEIEDEVQEINPQQYQKIALSAYETHLRKIEVKKRTPMPLVPLCHLKEHPVVRPRRERIEQLALLFESDGYLKEKANFICSLESPEQDIQEIQKGEILSWDKIWRKQHDDFEARIKGTEWEALSNKYLYTWDGNHRLAAWTKIIKQGDFENDLDRHPCVKVTLVHADLKNQAGLMHVVARLNKYNDIGYVSNTFVDYVSLVRGLGLADKKELLQTLDFTIPKFVSVEMDKRHKISTPWYGVPLSVLSQMIDPDEYAAKMTKTFAKKTTMQPLEWEELFKKDFFEVTPKLLKRARYAVTIADPGLGDQWWSAFLAIEWEKKPKWLTEEKIYALACAEMTNDRKQMALVALAGHSSATLSSMGLGETADQIRFREWIDRDSFWHSLSKKAFGIIQGLKGVYNNLPRETKFFQWLDLMRDIHHQFMFLGEASSRKALKKQTERDDLLQMPTRRMIYRWLVDECNEDVYSQGVFLEWCNKDSEATMYTTTQKAADWPPIVYKKCPFFLDYPHGKYPDDEAADYEDACKKFKQMVVQPTPIEEEHSPAPKKRKGKEPASSKPPRKNKKSKEAGPVDTTQHEDKPLSQDSSLRVTDYIDPTNQEPMDDTVSYAPVDEDVLEKELDDTLKSFAQEVLYKSIVPGGYYRVPLQTSGTSEQNVFEISQVLMPIYQSLGKFTPTTEGIAACAVDMVIMHIPTDFPVKGFDMNTCPNWNTLNLSTLHNSMGIAKHFLKADGILLCVCSAAFSGTISTYANAANFREDHAIGVFTKGIHGVINEVPSVFLLLMAFRKDDCYQPIPRPKIIDIIMDDNNPSTWMKKEDGTPWRGGFERGFQFWRDILAAYTKPGDIILQLLSDGPMLPAIGVATGRHILQADKDHCLLECIQLCHANQIELVMGKLPPF